MSIYIICIKKKRKKNEYLNKITIKEKIDGQNVKPTANPQCIYEAFCIIPIYYIYGFKGDYANSSYLTFNSYIFWNV